MLYIFRTAISYSQRIQTNLLHNTPFHLWLEPPQVLARFIGHIQG